MENGPNGPLILHFTELLRENREKITSSSNTTAGQTLFSDDVKIFNSEWPIRARALVYV